MQEYIFPKAKVRIHGSCDPENLKAATEIFLKKVERKRKNEQKNKKKTSDHS